MFAFIFYEKPVLCSKIKSANILPGTAQFALGETLDFF